MFGSVLRRLNACSCANQSSPSTAFPQSFGFRASIFCSTSRLYRWCSIWLGCLNFGPTLFATFLLPVTAKRTCMSAMSRAWSESSSASFEHESRPWCKVQAWVAHSLLVCCSYWSYVSIFHWPILPCPSCQNLGWTIPSACVRRGGSQHSTMVNGDIDLPCQCS